MVKIPFGDDVSADGSVIVGEAASGVERSSPQNPAEQILPNDHYGTQDDHVSGDGKVVVGRVTINLPQPTPGIYRWENGQATKIIPLGTIYNDGASVGVSHDGGVIAGSLANGSWRAFRYAGGNLTFVPEPAQNANDLGSPLARRLGRRRPS